MKTFRGVIFVGFFVLIFTSLSFAMCLKSRYVSGGEDHTLVLTESGLVFSCGANYSLQLGRTSGSQYRLFSVEDGDMETDSDYLENISRISSGWNHSLANDEYGFVWSWGRNDVGQLGVGEEPGISPTPLQVKAGEQNPVTDPNDPLYIEFLQDIIDIAAGRSGNHSLAVDKYGLAWSWGRNVVGELGCGDTENRFVPVAVYAGEQNPTQEPNQLKHIIEVSGGAYHSMALEDPNQGAHVYTFGSDDSIYGGPGLLGIGTVSAPGYRTEPVKVLSGEQDPEHEDTYLQNIVALSAGWHHSMALETLDENDPNSNGRVYTWGWNGHGWLPAYGGPGCLGVRLGNGNINDEQLIPVLVKSGEQDPEHEDTYLKDIIAISAGESHSMALDKDGFVWTWGDNSIYLYHKRLKHNDL